MPAVVSNKASAYAIVIQRFVRHCHTTMTASSTVPSSVLSVRVNANERALLEAASNEAHTSLSDFVRRRALEAAEIEVMDRRVVTIPADHWDALEGWFEEPAREVPALEELAGRSAVGDPDGRA